MKMAVFSNAVWARLGIYQAMTKPTSKALYQVAVAKIDCNMINRSDYAEFHFF